MPPGKFFTLHPVGVASCLVEVEGGSSESGAAVVTRRPHGTGESPSDEQLWWEDRINHSIRSKLNNFCLTAIEDGRIVTHNFQPMNRHQRWRFDGSAIVSRDGEMVLGLSESESHPGGHVYKQDKDDSFSEEWVKEHVDAYMMHIRNCSTNKVLDVAWESKEPGAAVIVYDLWPELKNNQLWYEDHNGVIKSKMNDFALTSSGGKVTLDRYKAGNKIQQWIVSQQAIVNRQDPDQVLDIHVPISFFKKLKNTEVTSGAYNGNASQRWEFLYSDYNDATFGPKSHLVYLAHCPTGLYLTSLPLKSIGIPSDRIDAVLLPKKPHVSVDQLWSFDVREDRIVSAADGAVLDLSERAILPYHTHGNVYAATTTTAIWCICGGDGVGDSGCAGCVGSERRRVGEASVSWAWFKRESKIAYVVTFTVGMIPEGHISLLSIWKESVLNRPEDSSPNQRWKMVAMTIQNQSVTDLHLGTASGILSPDEDGILRVVARPMSAQQMPDLWKATKAPARFFYIKSKHCDLVLDVKGGDADSGGEVITFSRKPGPPAANQLWYEDEDGVIRSKLNNYLMDSSGKKVCMRPFNPNNPDQQWSISGDVIKNRAKPDLALDISGGSTKEVTPVIPYAFHGGTNQRWTFIYI